MHWRAIRRHGDSVDLDSGTWLLFHKDEPISTDFVSSFVAQQELTISDADSQRLYANIACGKVPEGASLTLWLVQRETAASVEVAELSEPLLYPLSEFEKGKVQVRLQIDGVEDVIAELCLT